MANAAVGLSQIGQISVTIHDLERAVGFYRDTLGMQHLFTVPPKMAFFDAAGVRLMLGIPDSPEPIGRGGGAPRHEPKDPQFDHPSSVLYFTVEDIQGTCTSMKAKGVSFEGAPHIIAKMPTYDLWMAFFRDSEGNLLALMSEVARS